MSLSELMSPRGMVSFDAVSLSKEEDRLWRMLRSLSLTVLAQSLLRWFVNLDLVGKAFDHDHKHRRPNGQADQ